MRFPTSSSKRLLFVQVLNKRRGSGPNAFRGTPVIARRMRGRLIMFQQKESDGSGNGDRLMEIDRKRE